MRPLPLHQQAEYVIRYGGPFSSHPSLQAALAVARRSYITDPIRRGHWAIAKLRDSTQSQHPWILWRMT